MMVFSTRRPMPWSMSQHGQRRAYERSISHQEIQQTLAHPQWTRASKHHGSSARVLHGENGVTAVVDVVRRQVITVHRAHYAF